MPTPIAPRIILAQNARVDLPTLVEPILPRNPLALRARMILRAAAVDQPTNPAHRPRVGVFQPHRGHMATTPTWEWASRFARC